MKSNLKRGFSWMVAAALGLGIGVARGAAIANTPPVAPNPNDNILSPGESLLPGQRVVSDNEMYELVLQNDGNLVLYQLHENYSTVLWSAETDGRPVERAVMQPDGNFVLYGPGSLVIWSSETDSYPDAYLMVQDDGNIVIYFPKQPIWETNTVPASSSSPSR
jgi:hypothetical protein